MLAAKSRRAVKQKNGSRVVDQLSAASRQGAALSYQHLNLFGWFDM
jgi:hypothetical protein